MENMLKHRTKLKRLVILTLAIVGLVVVLPAATEAVPISGDLNIGGRVRVDGTSINWLPLLSDPSHDFTIFDATEYLAFLVAPGSSFVGDAMDLSAALHPVGVDFFLADFLTFEDDPGLSFNLTYIAPCNPADCLFPNTPFNAYQSSNPLRTTIEMGMRGTATDSTPNSGPITVDSNWTGTWSADFNQQTINQLRAAFAPGGAGFIVSPYSADLTVTFIPEPMTLLTFGTGTALLALHRRRRARRNLA